jgi:DNA-binding PadR family transcriptional regulator
MLPAHKTSKEASKAKRRSTSALRGPLLGLLINQEQPSHIYKLKGLLAQCLPMWRVEKSHVRYTLRLLQSEGLAHSITSTEGGLTVFAPTDQTRFALDEWMEQSVSIPAVREELHARIVSSCPHHAPLLLEALDVFERRCYARLKETPGPEGSMRSWRSLMINAVHAAEDEDINAKIRWAKTTKKRIMDYGRQP